MHGKLKGDLIAGFLHRREHIPRWIEQLKVYCKIEKVINGTFNDHFDFLEHEGLIKIGEYAVLKDMFNQFDVTAIAVIDKASTEINRALQNS